MGREANVTIDRANQRFELPLGDGPPAFIQFREAGDGVLRLTHTEVPTESRGRGVGSSLVEGALELARSEGIRIVPRCSFVAAYIRRHPEYESLVDSSPTGGI